VNINYYPIPQQSLAQITPENIPAMGTPTLLELGEHIFYCINDFRGPIFKAAEMRIIAGNIAFLIKYTMNSYVDLPTVSIPYIAIRGPNNGEVGRKASIVFHEGPGKLNLIMEGQVEWSGDVMAALAGKVNEIVNRILDLKVEDRLKDIVAEKAAVKMGAQIAEKEIAAQTQKSVGN
jgi:hypothetical protein